MIRKETENVRLASLRPIKRASNCLEEQVFVAKRSPKILPKASKSGIETSNLKFSWILTFFQKKNQKQIKTFKNPEIFTVPLIISSFGYLISIIWLNIWWLRFKGFLKWNSIDFGFIRAGFWSIW